MFEANKKQAPLKSYPLKIRIDSVNQNLKDKEKVTDQTESPTGRFHVYTHVYHIIKNQGPGPYNSLYHAENIQYFSCLSLMQSQREAHMFYLVRKWEKFAEQKVTLSWLMNSGMVKPEKFDHLHLVYHFTVPLNWPHFDKEPRFQEKQKVKDQEPCIFVFVLCLTIPISNWGHQPRRDNSFVNMGIW